MSVRVLIVEDEPLIAEDIAQSLREMEYEVTAICESADEALASIQNIRPDIALLDIQIEGAIDGIMLAGILRSEYDLPFIFITSNSDSATIDRLSRVHPAGFLSKPYNERSLYGTLKIALSKVAESTTSEDTPQASASSKNMLFIRNKDRLERVEENQIDYVQAYDNYCFVHANRRRYLIPHTLKEVENRLNTELFMRVHRSYLVNIERIVAIDELGIEVAEERVPLSKNQRKELLQRIQLL